MNSRIVLFYHPFTTLIFHFNLFELTSTHLHSDQFSLIQLKNPKLPNCHAEARGFESLYFFIVLILLYPCFGKRKMTSLKKSPPFSHMHNFRAGRYPLPLGGAYDNSLCEKFPLWKNGLLSCCIKSR